MGNKKAQAVSPGWILILIFIFIMAATIGIILYNQTAETKHIIITNQTDRNISTANGVIIKPPTINNNNSTQWQWKNLTNITPNTNISEELKNITLLSTEFN